MIETQAEDPVGRPLPCTTSLSHEFLTFRLVCSSHMHPTEQFHFPVATETGRRSCLLMAPGACGSLLANQCESTSGTSLGQTICLSAHSACCQTPVPFRPVPKRGRHPLGGSARSHIRETFPKAFPVLLASRRALTSLPSCVLHKHAGGPKGSGGRRCPSVRRVCATCSDHLTAFHPGRGSFFFFF